MADKYALAAARISALALVDASGFNVVQQSCVDILADLLLRYIQEVGAGSHHYAELAGRSETNPVDVALALNDMGTSIEQLKDFVQNSTEVPFEHAISDFPRRKQSRPQPTFMERGEVPPPHIPPWLLALPDRHTYAATPVYPGHEKDPQKQQVMLTGQRQEAETALVRLHARMAGATNQLLAAKLEGLQEAGGGAGQEADTAAEGQQQQREQEEAAGPGQDAEGGAAGNPFLAAPWSSLASESQQQPGLDGAPGGVAAGLSAELGGAGSLVAQQPFASHDWKAQQQRKALVATGGRVVREAFGEAYDEQAAQRLGKRQKRSGASAAAAAAAAGANDPTRARVEGILAAAQPAAVASASAPQDLQQEEI